MKKKCFFLPCQCTYCAQHLSTHSIIKSIKAWMLREKAPNLATQIWLYHLIAFFRKDNMIMSMEIKCESPKTYRGLKPWGILLIIKWQWLLAEFPLPAKTEEGVSGQLRRRMKISQPGWHKTLDRLTRTKPNGKRVEPTLILNSPELIKARSQETSELFFPDSTRVLMWDTICCFVSKNYIHIYLSGKIFSTH